MCTYEGQFSQAKKLILELLTQGAHTIQKIKEYLHNDALMSQDHTRVQEIFFRVLSEMIGSGQIKADCSSLSDTTVVSLVH